MPNTLGTYNPIFYAQEALIQLEKALGMAGRIHRGYDAERRSFNKGDTIDINKPGTFTAQDAPSSAQALTPKTVALTLNNWREVKFTLTDKELAFTTEKIINDHIRPAAYALADDIDQKLCALYKDIPWLYALNATPGSVVTDITGPMTTMFNNAVPMIDPRELHYMVNGTLQQGLLGNSAFAQWQGAGPQGVDTQMRGAMGMRYGFNFFANQNVATHTAGTYANSSTDANLTGAHTAGATSVAFDGVSLTGTLKAGDTLVIAGNTQRYAVTALATASGNAITVSVIPALVQDYTADSAVTVTSTSSTDGENLVFHRNAFALAMAPLSDIGNQLGAKIASITDPITGLSIRSRLFYDGNNSAVYVALDVLYGLKTLDPNLAVRARK